MAGIRLRLVESEKPIPDGQAKTEIAIGFNVVGRVMNPVHVRRHNQLAQRCIYRPRQGPVGMVELCKGVQGNLKEKGGPGRNAEREHDGGSRAIWGERWDRRRAGRSGGGTAALATRQESHNRNVPVTKPINIAVSLIPARLLQ